jgi:hypothetical protein
MQRGAVMYFEENEPTHVVMIRKKQKGCYYTAVAGNGLVYKLAFLASCCSPQHLYNKGCVTI